MKERRISPRNKCPASLTYRVLNDKGYRELMKGFLEKRDRIVLFDKLDLKNRMASLKINKLDNELTGILSDINDQLKSLVDTFTMDSDILYNYVDSDVSINSAGMLFQTKEVLKTGSAIEVHLRLSPDLPRLLIVAEVIRSEQIGSSKKASTAIAFTFTEPEDKAILAEFITQQSKDTYIRTI